MRKLYVAQTHKQNTDTSAQAGITHSLGNSSAAGKGLIPAASELDCVRSQN